MCLCFCKLRESSKYGLGWINTAFVVIQLAFSSLYISVFFSSSFSFLPFLSTLPWFPFLFVLFSAPAVPFPQLNYIAPSLFCASAFFSTISSSFVHLLSNSKLFLFSLAVVLSPHLSRTILLYICPAFFITLPLTLPLPPSAVLSSFLPCPWRQRRAKIYILIYQFPAAVEAVMDGVMLAHRRCHELPWWLPAETATHWPLHHNDW